MSLVLRSLRERSEKREFDWVVHRAKLFEWGNEKSMVAESDRPAIHLVAVQRVVTRTDFLQGPL